MGNPFDKIRLSSLFGHNRTVDVCTRKTDTKVAMRDDTNINVENPQWWEKNHGSPQTAKCTMMRRLQTMGAQGKQPLVSPLPSPHAAVTTRRQLPLSLTLYTANSIQ